MTSTDSASRFPGANQYLARYAEPEIRLASGIAARYAAVLVVPVFGEPERFIDGYRAAAAGLKQATGSRPLGILVVNHSRTAPLDFVAANQDLLSSLRARLRRLEFSEPELPYDELESFDGGSWLADEELDWLVVDCASPGRELPEKQGVGLARKIGSDLALTLIQRGAVDDPFIYSTDADVSLPADYFLRTRAATSSKQPPVAVLFPFEHVPSGDLEIDEATWKYEASLRYFVTGLRFARSPSAFHTVGSTLAVDAEAYAKARGFPKRLAGEDFYLLDKLAKLGPIAELAGARIAIQSRRSGRTPFGTGSAVERLTARDRATAEASPRVYHPRSFHVLRSWLGYLERVAQTSCADEAGLVASAGGVLPSAELAGLVRFAHGSQAFTMLRRIVRNYADEARTRRGIFTWFDRFQTMKLFHELRAAGLPDVELFEAIERAGHLPEAIREAARRRAPELGELLRAYDELASPSEAQSSSP